MGTAPCRHRLNETARFFITELLVDVACRAIRRVDVEDDEVAGVEQVLSDGGGYGGGQAVAAEVGVGKDVADDADALRRE